jgi:hypothetical protein
VKQENSNLQVDIGGTSCQVLYERKLRMGSIMLGYVKRSLPLRRTLVLLFLVLLSVLLGYGIYNCLKKELRIIDGDKNIFVKTMGEDIETAMNQLGINVGL